MKQLLATLLILTFATPSLFADDCHVRRQFVVKNAIVKQVVADDFYYPVGASLRQELNNGQNFSLDDIERAVSVLERLLTLLDRLRGRGGASVGKSMSEMAGEKPNAAPTPLDTNEAKFAAIVREKCLKCHSGPSANGGLDLLNQGNWSKHACDIYATTNLGIMPKGGEPLTDEEMQVIAEFYSKNRK